MAYGNQVKTDALSTVYTSEAYPLGSVYVEPADEVVANGSGVSTTTTFSLLKGDRTWVFIKAFAAISAGDLVKVQAANTPFFGNRDNSNEGQRWKFLGIADHAIALNEYGWIIKQGTCVVQAETDVAAFDLLASDGNTTAGEVDTIAAGTTGDKIIGYALEAEGATFAGFAQAMISIP
jgi:hypothetical protein